MIGNPNTILQYIPAGINKDKIKVKINEKVIPNTIPIWFKGHKMEANSVGENSRIYKGLTALIIPMQKPCNNLTIKSM